MGQRLIKIKGSSLEQAHDLMRTKFGDTAVVLNTRNYAEGGVLGFFARNMVELTVAIDEPAPSAKPGVTTALQRRYAENVAAAAQPGELAGGQTPEELALFLRSTQARLRNQPTPPAPGEPPGLRVNAQAAAGDANNMVQFPQRKPEEADDTESLKREIREIREMMQVLYAENPGAGLPAEFGPHYRRLVERGVSRKTAAALLGRVVKECDLEVLRDTRVLAERLAFEMRRMVQVTGGIGLTGGKCRRVMLCGATGVGKTTSLAKLAGQFSGVRERARVALITTDTYRIGAPEQLRVYAQIMGVPLSVADDPAALRRALQKYEQHDLVLIDTAGGSQYNLEHLNELRAMQQAAAPHEVMLAVGAGSPMDDMRSVLSNFSCLNPTSLLFTKIDETRQYGALFSLTVESGLPVSYLSVGQGVPDDIAVASTGKIAHLLLQGSIPHGGPSTTPS
ncbi:MAG: flagellar biosynthesis protein FlhF [Candidatus Hydrogenedens sp.]|nr:flagellar biosynthesis protein FlhF [Candidatus Hydrogenedens sp.]